MENQVHLRHPLGGTFCEIEGYLIYTKKGQELANLDRLVEVTCKNCLDKACNYYDNHAWHMEDIAHEIYKQEQNNK